MIIIFSIFKERARLVTMLVKILGDVVLMVTIVLQQNALALSLIIIINQHILVHQMLGKFKKK